MPRRSARVVGSTSGRNIVNSKSRKLTKAAVKKLPAPKLDVAQEGPAIAIHLVSSSTSSSSPSSPVVDIPSNEKHKCVEEDDIEKGKKKDPITVTANNPERPNRRAATKMPVKYVEEDDSTTDEDRSSSSDGDGDNARDDVDDIDYGSYDEGPTKKQNGKQNRKQNRKRPPPPPPRQKAAASSSSIQQRPRKTSKTTAASSSAPRKPLKELSSSSHNKNNKIAPGKIGSSIKENISKVWEPNKGGDWRDACALDY
jgi:hypothetical protein